MAQQNGKNRATRRTAVRRLSVGELLAEQFSLLRRKVGWRSAAVLLGLILATVLVASADSDELPYRAGDWVRRPIIARVEFSQENSLETQAQRNNAKLATPNSYRFNETLAEYLRGELGDVMTAVRSSQDFAQFDQSGQNKWELTEGLFARVHDLLAGEQGTPESGERLRELGERVIAELHNSTLVRLPTLAERAKTTANEAVLLGRQPSERVPRLNLWYVSNNDHVQAEVQRIVAATVPREYRALMSNVLRRVITDESRDGRQAAYVFDAQHTAQQIALADQLPPMMASFKEGTPLVNAGRELTLGDIALLDAEHKEWIAARHNDPNLRGPYQQERMGRIGLAVLIVMAIIVYTSFFRLRILEIHTRAMGLAGAVLAVAASDWFILSRQVSPYVSLISVSIVATLLTLAYDRRYALGIAGLVSLLSAVVMNEDVGFWLVQISAAATAVMLLPIARTRMVVALILGVTFITTFSVAAIAEVWHVEALERILQESAKAGLASATGVCIVFVLQPLIEKGFNITTPLSLLEWADNSQPLLKQLMHRAPGTWQHSNLLANMAEAAAEEVGANGLLVRVGALYHDIGKMNKPEYFTENQQAHINAHSRLSPTMSLLVILGHVKDGLAIAKEHSLPTAIQRFIGEHHGTTVVKYFHVMASQLHAAKGGSPQDREVDESEFRYPGPKPQSRETAILMLCDSVEGAVRSLQDPTPGRIESVVHQIMMARLMDGQFDECEITLRDLYRIEQSVVKSLCAIHHGRIAYPKSSDKDAA